MSRKSSSLPAPLIRCARAFETCRRTRIKQRIPETLWKRAADLARRYGVAPTARALKLDYAQLKRRVVAAEVGTAAQPKGQAPAFLEVIPINGAAVAECRLEFEDPRGTSLRVDLKGAGPAELAALIGAVMDKRSCSS